MKNWSGKLYNESKHLLAIGNLSAKAYTKEHTRQSQAPWVPIQGKMPSEGLLIALNAIESGVPFLFLESNELASDFDTAVIEAYERHKDQSDSICLFSRSSGTSGRVKLIPRTLRSWIASFEAHRLAFNLDNSQRWLIPGQTGFSATVYHGLLGLFYGKEVYIQGSLSPSATLSLIFECEIDTLFTVPTRLGLILKAASRKNSDQSSLVAEMSSLCSLNKVITVGEMLSSKVNYLATQLLPNAELWHYYGAAELGQVAYCSFAELALSPNLLGHPFIGVRVSIDEEENIRVCSPYLAMDYKAPATVYDKGYMALNQLYFKGREDLQFNRHGKKYSLEGLQTWLATANFVEDFWIERVIQTHNNAILDGYQLHVLIDTEIGNHPEANFLPEVNYLEDGRVLEIQEFCKHFFSPKKILIYKTRAYTSGGKLAWLSMIPKQIISL